MKISYSLTALNTATFACGAAVKDKRQDVSALVSAIEAVASIKATSTIPLVGVYTATKTQTPEKRQDVSKLMSAIVAVANQEAVSTAPLGVYTATPTLSPVKAPENTVDVVSAALAAAMEATSTRASVGVYTANNTPSPISGEEVVILAEVLGDAAAMMSIANAILTSPMGPSHNRTEEARTFFAYDPKAITPATYTGPPQKRQENALDVLCAALATSPCRLTLSPGFCWPTPTKRDVPNDDPLVATPTGSGYATETVITTLVTVVTTLVTAVQNNHPSTACTNDGMIMPCGMSMSEDAASISITTSSDGDSATGSEISTSCASSTNTTISSVAMTTVTDYPLFSTGGVLPLWQLTNTQRNNTRAPVTDPYFNISTFSASLSLASVTTVTTTLSGTTSQNKSTEKSTKTEPGTTLSTATATDDAAAGGFPGAVTSYIGGNSSSGAMAMAEIPGSEHAWMAFMAMAGVFGAALLL